jgi:TP901 family phage tail tape measure protein
MSEIVRRSIIVSYQDNSKQFVANQKKVQDETSSLTKKLGTAATAVLALATAGAALAIFKDAAKTVSDFQVSLKQLQSLTGLSGDAVNKLGDTAISMSTRFGTSATEIVNAFAKVGSAAPQLLGNADALAEVARQSEILSFAAGTSLDDAISAVTKTLNQYGLDASQAAAVSDTLAFSQQQGTATVNELTESLKNVGSVAAAQNISLQDTTAALQGLAKGGLTGAEAGTQLRSVYLSLAKTGRDDLNPATQKFSDILKTLGKEVTTVNQAQKIFGKESAAAALTLIKQADTVDKLSGNVDSYGSALLQATLNTETNAAALDKSAAAWDALILSIDKGDGVLSRGFKRLFDNTTQFLKGIAALNSDVGKFTSSSLLDLFNEIGRTTAQINRAEDAFKSFTGDRESVEGLKVEIDLLKALQQQAENLVVNASAGEKGDADRALGLKKLKEFTNQLNVAQEQLSFLTENSTELSKEAAAAAAAEAETLGSLKKELSALKSARDEINVTDTAALSLNESQIKSLQKRIESLSITTSKTKELTEAQKENVEQSIKALQVGLIQDEPARQIASLELKAEVDTSKVTGTDEQIATQKALIAQKLAVDINAIVQAGLDADLEAIKASLDAQKALYDQSVIDIAEGNDKLQEDAESAADQQLAAFEFGKQKEILAVKENIKNKVVSEEEGNIEILRKELEILQQRALNANLSGEEQIAIKQSVVDAQINLEKTLTAQTQEQAKARLNAVAQSVNQITNVLKLAFDREKERIDRSIEAQQERVKKAAEIASEGNAEILQIEEERLEKLNQAKEKAVKKERALAAIQLAINAALAISQAILTITKAGSQGGIFGVIAGAIALAASIAAGIIGIKSALSDVPAYAEGKDLIVGKGNAKSDSITARLSNGEGVIPAENNKQLLKTGIGVTDKRLPALVQAGLDAKAMRTPRIASSAFTKNEAPVTADNKGIEKRLDQTTKAIKDLRLTAEIKHDEIKLTNKKNSVRDRRNKQRIR